MRAIKSEYICSRGADAERGERIVATIHALGANECTISLQSNPPFDAAPDELVKACKGFSLGQGIQRDLHQEFDDTGLEAGDKVRPVLSDETVAPGTTLWVAVRNDLRDEVSYGLPSHVETLGGERLGKQGPSRLPLLIARQHSGIGPCVPIQVPETAEPGVHLAVVDGVNFPDGETREVSAPFVVAKVK